MNPPVVGVIPARLASRRLPGKPLHPILGRPLLEWVWRRVAGMGLFDRVTVATDAPKVRELCEAMGAPCVMTSPEHASGTDRVAEAVQAIDPGDEAVIVNVQGDEPLIEEAHLESAVALVRDGGWDVGTCATPVRDRESWRDPSVVKVVRATNGRALYFTRAPVPFSRDGEPSAEMLERPPYLRHVGIYVYRTAALRRWVALEPSPLEALERLEQLRALEAGIPIGVAVVSEAHPGVDTPADVVRMEQLIEELSPRDGRTLTMNEST